MCLVAGVSTNTHMSRRSDYCSLAIHAFHLPHLPFHLFLLLRKSYISLLYLQKSLKSKTTVQYVRFKSKSCLSASRLLEDAGSSLTGVIQHPDSASLTSSGHTRVLRVAPVSSHFGPPSFPASSASLDLPDEHVAPVPRQPLSTAPGGLSRSLSASASSGGQIPNGISTHGVSQTVEQQA